MIAPVLQARDHVPLVHPLAAFDEVRDWHGLPGHVEVERARDVHAVLRDEQPEGAANARVHVEHLVPSVAGIVAIADVEHAAIAELLHPATGGFLHDIVLQAYAQAGGPRVDGRLTQLAAGEADEAIRLMVEVAVEHPDHIVAARNVFLQHQVRIGWVLHLPVQPYELVRVIDDDHLPAGSL